MKRLSISDNPKSYKKFKDINGWKAEAKVGYYVVPDGWGLGQCLISSHWDKADFYLPTGYNFGTKEIATNIYITGRKFIYNNDGIYVRVQIEFVGDGEPSTYTYGVMKLTNMDQIVEGQ